MANITQAKQTRMRELHKAGMSPAVISNNVGLNRETVVNFFQRGGIEIKTEDKSLPKPKRTGRQRPGQAFKDWKQRDYADFVERWQENPNIEVHEEALDRTEEEIKWLCQWLRNNGVKLKKTTHSPVCDFEALKEIVKEGD